MTSPDGTGTIAESEELTGAAAAQADLALAPELVADSLGDYVRARLIRLALERGV